MTDVLISHQLSLKEEICIYCLPLLNKTLEYKFMDMAIISM